jgi:hypothetical protein
MPLKSGYSRATVNANVQARNAADLYQRFTGHDALEEVQIDKPVFKELKNAKEYAQAWADANLKFSVRVDYLKEV